MECVLLLQSMKSGQIVFCKTATSFWFRFLVANRANAVKVFISQTEFLLALTIGLMDLAIPAFTVVYYNEIYIECLIFNIGQK